MQKWLYFLLGFLSFPLAWAGPAEVISLTANPSAILADGYSRTVITAEVRERNGNPVPDDTEVRFSTTVGTIDPLAKTSSGRARVTFISAPLPGVAIITATSGRAISSLRVLLLREGERPPERPHRILLEGNYLAYSADYRYLLVENEAQARIGDLVIRGSRIGVEVDRGHLWGEGNVLGEPITVSDGRTTWKGSRLKYSLQSGEGLFQVDQVNHFFTGPPLRELPPPSQQEGTPSSGGAVSTVADPPDLSDTRMWITAKSAVLYPGQRILFYSAQLRPDGRKLISLPYHVLLLAPDSQETFQYVGLGTEGLSVDLPYYLRLTPGSATSVHLSYNRRQGSFSAIRGGLGLDLQHRIYHGPEGDDILSLDRFNSGDWGLSWRHYRQWRSGISSSATVEFPAHRDLFALGSLQWQGNRLAGFLQTSFFNPQAGGWSWNTNLSLQTLPKSLGLAGLRQYWYTTLGFALGRGGSEFQQGLFHRAFLPSQRVSNNLFFSASFITGRVLSGSQAGTHLEALMGWNYSLGRAASLALDYTYSRRPSRGGLGFSSLQGHRISLQFYYDRSPWSFVVYSTTVLNGSSNTVVTQLTRQLGPRWRLDLRASFLRYRQLPFTDYELALTRTIAGRDITLYWSRQRRRLGVLLGGVAF